MHATLLPLLKPSHLAERTTWPMLTAHKLQLKPRQMSTAPCKHTLRNDAHRNTWNMTQKYSCCHMNAQLLHRITGIKRYKYTHTHTHIFIHMLLSECCLLTRCSITKRFSLPHTYRGEGKVCVRALVPLKLLFVCVHTFFFYMDVMSAWVCGESLWCWEAQTTTKIKFYSNFYLFVTNQQQADKFIAWYLGGMCHLKDIQSGNWILNFVLPQSDLYT